VTGADARRDVVVDGARLAVFARGDGEPCLLLHGYPQSHWCWRRVVAPLAATHRVLAPDWIGWGDSERSLRVAPVYDDEVARLERLLDALGGKTVAAHSGRSPTIERTFKRIPLPSGNRSRS
jgi:pimeloyl-ACP methyl ester carboxylesterase